MLLEKYCGKCDMVRKVTDFSKDVSKEDGLTVCCKECNSKNEKEWRNSNKNREVIVIPELKTCPGCRIEKDTALYFNKGIGLLQDSPVTLRTAATYLEKYSGTI